MSNPSAFRSSAPDARLLQRAGRGWAPRLRLKRRFEIRFANGQPKKKGSERRKYARVDLNLLIQYRFDSLDEFLVEYASNISEGGIFLRTDAPRNMGSMVYLQFALRDGTTLIEGLGKVVHVNPAGSAEPGLGIEFVSLDEDSKEMIRAIVNERLSEHGSS